MSNWTVWLNRGSLEKWSSFGLKHLRRRPDRSLRCVRQFQLAVDGFHGNTQSQTGSKNAILPCKTEAAQKIPGMFTGADCLMNSQTRRVRRVLLPMMPCCAINRAAGT